MKTQGTIKEYFSKVLIPKECMDQKKLVMETNGGKRKRKVEEVGAMEDLKEPPRTKSRLATNNGGRNPEELTGSEGTSLKMGAKSISGREPTHGLGIGALDFGLIGRDQLNEERKTPGGIGQMDLESHKYSC